MFRTITRLYGILIFAILSNEIQSAPLACTSPLPSVELSNVSTLSLSGVLAKFSESGSYRPGFLASSKKWCVSDGSIWTHSGQESIAWYGLNLKGNADLDIDRALKLEAPQHNVTSVFVIKDGVVTGLEPYNRDNLSFGIKVRRNETVTLLVSVKSGDDYLGASLYDLPHYLESTTNRILTTSLIVGAIFCMLLFQGLTTATTREQLPLTCLALSVFAYEFVNLGFAVTALGNTKMAMTEFLPTLELTILISATAFTASFFELSKSNRQWLGLFQIAVGALSILAIAALLDPMIVRSSAGYLAFAPIALIAATVVLKLKVGRSNAGFFCLALIPTLVGAVIVKGTLAGTLNYEPALMLAEDIGLSITLLSLILLASYRSERVRRDQELDLRYTQRRYQLALEGSNDGIFEWDLANGMVLASQRAHEIVGLDYVSGWRQENSLKRVVPEPELERISRMRESMFLSKDMIRVETYCFDSYGNKIFLLLQGKLDFDAKGKPNRIIGSISDVSEQKHLEKRLRHDALHDFLTGLPNRTLLIDRMQRIVERLKRNPDSRAALLFLDVDNFKAINDNLGHGFGDQVLVSLSERLLELVRSSDTVARLSGDEFVILLEDMFSHREAERFANRLLEKIHSSMEITGHHLVPSVSIGMTLVEDPKISVETVLGDADIAMYAAKERGKGRVVAFETTMRTRAAKRLEVESALRQAIENEELYLVYQPIFSIESDNSAAAGVEALLRWNRADRQDIAPAELLNLAEENGMIEDIGKWVIRTAARQLAQWRTQGYPDDFYVNINLSAVHFENEAIATTILKEIDPLGIPRNSLRIEIVETAVIRHPEKALSVIKLLQSQGILVSIDDFGTGFSSLSYLHRFPFFALKIDRSFVLEIAESKATRDIVTAIVVLARRLGIRVVAEGIEHKEQLEFLRSIGCEYAQGYLLARPVVADHLDQYFMDDAKQAASRVTLLKQPREPEKLPAFVTDATA